MTTAVKSSFTNTHMPSDSFQQNTPSTRPSSSLQVPAKEGQPPPQQTVDEEDLSDSHMEMDLSKQLRDEALAALKEEPELCALLHRTVLAPGVETFEDAVAQTVSQKLLPQTPGENAGPPVFCPESLRTIIKHALHSNVHEEAGHTMAEAVRRDAMAVLRRDPACQTLLEVVLFYKGFAALVCHRAARQKWMHAASQKKRSMTALFLQSQASAIFGVDIHPATTIGAGIMLDHGTGIVIGETATIGDGCTLLHGVTLGGTGKQNGDRHPKVGTNVLIGAGASILGNIRIGHGSKIGAGSIVLRPIPDGATAVGAPAKIIGRAMEAKPGSFMDDTLRKVALLHTSESMATFPTAETSVSSLSHTSTSTAAAAAAVTASPSSVPRRIHRPPIASLNVNLGSSSMDGELSSSDEREEEEDDDFLCPYRGYRKVRAPTGAITFGVLTKWMKGCTSAEIGNVFFALDKRNVGYVYWDVFQKEAPAILQKYVTSLDPQRIQSLLDQGTTIMRRASFVPTSTTSTIPANCATAAANAEALDGVAEGGGGSTTRDGSPPSRL